MMDACPTPGTLKHPPRVTAASPAATRPRCARVTKKNVFSPSTASNVHSSRSLPRPPRALVTTVVRLCIRRWDHTREVRLKVKDARLQPLNPVEFAPAYGSAHEGDTGGESQCPFRDL